MSEILTKKIYSKNKDTGVETQVYPETNAASVVDFDTAIAAKGFITSAAADSKIETAIGAINSFTTPEQVDTKINAALGGISTSTDTYTTLNNFDFNAGVDTLSNGSYIVTNAANTPFGNETSGVLKVMTTTSNTKIQTWNGKLYTAFREVGTFNPLEANIDSLTINGVSVSTSLSDTYTQVGSTEGNQIKITYEQKDTTNFNSGKILWLYPGGTYTLSGVLINCQIRVGYLSTWCDGGEFKAKKFDDKTDGCETTTIILNNFYLKMDRHLEYDAGDEDSWSAAFEQFSPLIMSEISGKGTRRGKIIINIADGTSNYIVRTLSETMETANNKWGVIYSDQDIDITGNGNLGIADGADNTHLLGCHAIKAKGQLHIEDQPHIVGRAYHDLLHGNDGLYIEGGYFQALYCNDVLGTDTSIGDREDWLGKIRIYNGIFDVRECYGTFIQADDVIVYPNVKITFNKIGEGLWLQCGEGFYKGEITKKGQIGDFILNDYTEHTYTKHTIQGVKLDAALFESYIEDVDSVTVYAEKTYKNAAKFNEALASTDPTKQPYIMVNDEYVLCEAGHAYDPDNETYYIQTEGTGAKVMYNGVATDVPTIKVTVPFPGITVYEGVTVEPDVDYVYAESNRNTHVSTLTNSATEPDGGWDYNLQFVATPTSTTITGELSVDEAAALLGSNTNNISQANFSAVDFVYSGTATGGIWNVGVTEQELTEYKNEVDYLLTCVKGMLVPPKEIDIIDVTTSSYNVANGLYDDEVTNLREDVLTNEGAEIAAGSTVAGQVTPNKIKAGGALYTSKTGIEPTITLEVGEAILVKAILLPENATNYAMKWSVVGKNDWVSIARLVTDDTMGCWVRGIQPGDEDIVVSAKALDKNNSKIKLTLHFVVTPKAGA